MKVLIIDHNWNKSWINLYIDSFKSFGCEVEVWDEKSECNPDYVVCTWADRDFTRKFPKATHMMMMRRFEFFHSPWKKFNWPAIKVMVFCNPFIAKQVSNEVKCGDTTMVLVRNSIDPTKWAYAERGHGKKIGMTCRIHPVKNLPLAAQIMLKLPKEYTLHIAGPVQDLNIFYYMVNTLGNRVRFYDEMPRESLDEWWDDKSYCLSSSISEGDPMGVLEAMSKGIMPVIHRWHGADELYDKTFLTVDEAVNQIINGDYHSSKYRKGVEENNSAKNIEFVAKLLLGKEISQWKA